jgi:hypothetical protein
VRGAGTEVSVEQQQMPRSFGAAGLDALDNFGAGLNGCGLATVPAVPYYVRSSGCRLLSGAVGRSVVDHYDHVYARQSAGSGDGGTDSVRFVPSRNDDGDLA